MPRNSYLGLTMLSTHPAFSLRSGNLHCPVCDERFGRPHEYDAHYLAIGTDYQRELKRGRCEATHAD